MLRNTPRNVPTLAATLVAALAAFLLVVGCGATSIPIPPAPAGPSDAADSGLGPGVRPLSFGPGDKGYPRVSPSGGRVAFVLDGSVVEKSFYARSFVRRTEEGFEAGGAEWLSEEVLAVLGREPPGGDASEADTPDSLFLTRQTEDPGGTPRLLEVAEGAGAMDTFPGGGIVAAMQAPQDAGNSKLVLLRGRVKPYPGTIPGRVLGISVSPDGTEAAIVVRRDEEGEDADRVELFSYRFPEGPARRVELFAGGQNILGIPQWTDDGIHFIAGDEGAPYALYRVSEDSEEPKPVRGVGEGFLPADIEASPGGDRLAVVGRRNATSPTDVYVLDLAAGTLEAVTANENMEVKADPRDLAWTPDGSGVVFVARVTLSGPEVYDAPARSLAPAFYNLYLAPAGGSGQR